MAKNKRPFSSFLENPEAKKAVQDALHAPAQLPDAEVQSPPALPVVTKQEAAAPKKAAKTEQEEPEPFQVVTIRKSVHRLLKMASAQYGIEIRELATEAIANHPKVKEMLKKIS